MTHVYCGANFAGPFSASIAQVIRQAKPDRLLIEPSGLGHPAGAIYVSNIVQPQLYVHLLLLYGRDVGLLTDAYVHLRKAWFICTHMFGQQFVHMPFNRIWTVWIEMRKFCCE